MAPLVGSSDDGVAVAAGAVTSEGGSQAGDPGDDVEAGQPGDVVAEASSAPVTLGERLAETTSTVIEATTSTIVGSDSSSTSSSSTTTSTTSEAPASTTSSTTESDRTVATQAARSDSTSPTAPSTTSAPPTTSAPTTTAPPSTTTTSPPTTQAPEQASSDDGGYAYDDPRGTQVWLDLGQCEAGGNWSINTGNGYYGGLQFSQGSWEAVGGTGYPHEHPRSTQIEMGRRLQARQGWGAWPHCSRELGLR